MGARTDAMLDWLFRAANRRPASIATPVPTEVAARVHACVVQGAMPRQRAWLALNVLLFWAMRDIAGFDVFRAFYRLSFGDDDDDWETAGIDALRERACRRAAASTGEPALESTYDPGALFDSVVAIMAEAFGVPERATRSGFDEEGYLRANPDVAAAVVTGRERSGLAHFIRSGEAEGRWQRRRGSDRHADLDFIFPIDLIRAGFCHSHLGADMPARAVALRDLTSTRGEGIAVSLLGESEMHDARSSLDLSLSQGTEIAACRALDAGTSWDARPAYVAALDDVCVDVDNGIVFPSRDKLWSDSCYATLLTHGGTVRSRDIFELAGRFARIGAAVEVTDLPQDAALLCCSWASLVNHGHWLMNTLFSIYLLRDPVSDGSLPLLCPRLNDTQSEHLTALGVPVANIIQAGTRYARCKRLLYPSPLTTNANLYPHSQTRAFAAWLKQHFPPEAQGPTPERIYLSRTGFPSGRRMENEADLEARLHDDFGFAIVRPHELSLREQIRVMSRAKIVVGQFGAALWNLAFAPVGTVLVEISSSNYATNEYLYLSHLMSHRFIRVMTQKEGTAYDGASFAFACPVESIAAIVRRLS